MAANSFDFGLWFQRLQANDNLIQDQYGQAFVHQPCRTFLQGKVSTYTYASVIYTSVLAFHRRRFLCRRCDKAETIGRACESVFEANLRMAGTRLTDAPRIMRSNTAGVNRYAGRSLAIPRSTVNKAKFLPATAHLHRMVSVRIKEDGDSGGAPVCITRLLDNLSYRLDQNGPYNTVLWPSRISRFQNIAPNRGVHGFESNPKRCTAGPADTDSGILDAENRTTALAKHCNSASSYVGSHGYHELLSVDANLPAPTILPGFAVPSGLSSWSVFTIRQARQLANNAVWNTTHWFSEGISSYHGLEVDVKPAAWATALQFSRGLHVFENAR